MFIELLRYEVLGWGEALSSVRGVGRLGVVLPMESLVPVRESPGKGFARLDPCPLTREKPPFTFSE